MLLSMGINEMIIIYREHGGIISMNEPLQLETYTGIIYYHAVWSGYAIFNLQSLLENTDVSLRISIHIFDIDLEYYQQNIETKLGHGHGWGDIFWIKNGNVIHREKNVMQKSDLVRITHWDTTLVA